MPAESALSPARALCCVDMGNHCRGVEQAACTFNGSSSCLQISALLQLAFAPSAHGKGARWIMIMFTSLQWITHATKCLYKPQKVLKSALR